MAVYVDSANIKWRNMTMCHMLADTLLELHEMAEKIGLKRAYFQDKPGDTPHYDVCFSRKQLALQNGAIEIDKFKVVEIIRKYRKERQKT